MNRGPSARHVPLLLLIVALTSCTGPPVIPARPPVALTPIVSITAPTAGAPVAGTITVAATATSDLGVAGVQFQLDGVDLDAEVSIAPYAVSWNTAPAPRGTHTLTAVVRDTAGNRATSDPVSVTVRLCVVLSVGGRQGLAHLGALDAAKARAGRVDCVVGNGIGALVGSLYASAPDADLRARYWGLISRYAEATRSEKASAAALGTCVGCFVGGAIGVNAPDPLELNRFQRVLDVYFGGLRIEDLGQVQFATGSLRVETDGARVIILTQGNLALAVARSIANPLVFPGLARALAQPSPPPTFIDPEEDRVAAVPVQDACALFGPARILAINVTDTAAIYSPNPACDVIEARVDPGHVSPRALQVNGPEFERAYRAGYDAVASVTE